MDFIPSLYDILAGICISIVIIHVIAGKNRTDKIEHFTLAALCLSLLFHILFEKSLYVTDDISNFIIFSKLDMVSLSFVGISLTWFVFYYSKDKSIWAGFLITVVYLFMLIVNIFTPNSILFNEVIGLNPLVLPWGETINFPDAQPNTWHFLIDFAILILITYLIFSGYRLYKNRQYKIAMLWLVLVSFVAFSLIWDYLSLTGVVRSPYLMPISLIVFAIAMSLNLLLRVIGESRVTDEILEKERRWQTLFENVNLIVVGLNRMGNVDYVNPYFCEFTGFDPEEVIGKDWFDGFVPKTHAYDVQGAFLEILKNDFHPHYENPIIVKSGEERMIAWYNVRLTDLRGKIIGSFSIGADITRWCSEVKELKAEIDGKDAI